MIFPIIFLNSDFSVDIALISSSLLGNVLYRLLREACLKIYIYVLVQFLCYVENLENYFFTIIYVSYQENETRT